MTKNLTLFFVTLLMLYALLEVIFLYALPRIFPSSIVVAAEEGLQPLFQSSKRGIVPENYIALMGDSNAAGMGDWAIQTLSVPMAQWHTAHLLHSKLGRDVVTFGSPGTGSVRAMVTEPISQLAYSNRYTLYNVPDPDLVLVYFYEGNDLYDNAEYFQYSFPKLFDISMEFDTPTYQRYLQQFALEHDGLYRKAQRHDWQRYLPFTGFVKQIVRGLRGLPKAEDPDNDGSLDPPWRFGTNMFKLPGHVNQAQIDGKLFQLPDTIQGPAIGLNEIETKRAWFAFEQALQFSCAHFSKSRFVLVYIPSVLSVYDIHSDRVSIQSYQQRPADFTLQQARLTSDAMRKRFKEIAAQQQLPVIDATDALRATAQFEPIHGPKDWNHLNQKGYEVLADVIEENLR